MKTHTENLYIIIRVVNGKLDQIDRTTIRTSRKDSINEACMFDTKIRWAVLKAKGFKCVKMKTIFDY